MPVFNGTIVPKKLWNIFNKFFRTLKKLNRGFILLNTLIVTQILRHYAKGTSAIIARCFFQFKIISQEKDGKNLVLLYLKSKFEWNLKEAPIFQLGIAVSTSINEKDYWKGALTICNFVWNVNIFQSSSLIVIAKNFIFYIRSRVIP